MIIKPDNVHEVHHRIADLVIQWQQDPESFETGKALSELGKADLEIGGLFGQAIVYGQHGGVLNLMKRLRKLHYKALFQTPTPGETVVIVHHPEFGRGRVTEPPNEDGYVTVTRIKPDVHESAEFTCHADELWALDGDLESL